MSQRVRIPLWLRGGMVILLLSLLTGFLPASTQAQGEEYFFPETGHYLRSTFRTFWDANGGIYLFGYPITEEYQDPQTGSLIQYFERARFEMKVLNGQPYIELGKLGSEITAGRSFPKAQPIQNTEKKRYIPQTQYIIQYGFKQIWETHGAERIFGLPLSNEVDEMMPDGSMRTVQYFERARFEYWPELPDGQRVVLSALGRMLAPPERTTPVHQASPPQPQQPQPQQPQPQQPEPQQPAIPADIDATVTPKSGPIGTDFYFQASNFEPNESVSVWMTSPDKQQAIPLDDTQANDDGTVTKVKKIRTGHLSQQGVWIITAQGIDSGHQSFAHFMLGETPAAAQTNTANCDPSYPDFCIPPGPPDLNCSDVAYCQFRVLQPDPHMFDNDYDGIGCEDCHGKTPADQAPAPASGGGQPVSNIPAPIKECANNAPAPVQGVAQAWVEKVTVDADIKDVNRLCVRLILNGQVIKGAEARGAVRFDRDPIWIGPELTREEDGVASLKFDVDKKEAGVTVRVDAEISYNGQSFTATTNFTPQ